MEDFPNYILDLTLQFSHKSRGFGYGVSNTAAASIPNIPINIFKMNQYAHIAYHFERYSNTT
jgi:hypothetical protein